MTIGKALKWGEKKLNQLKIKSAVIDAEIILSYTTNHSREQLFSHPENKISAVQWRKYQKLILRRTKFEPVAYLIGQKEFYGLNFKVNHAVLIPRPETEILVESVLKNLKKSKSPQILADIGTGSGNIAISLMKFAPQQINKIIVSDICQQALPVARQNAKKLLAKNHQKIKFLQSNLLASFPKNLKFDIICANLPYLDFKKIPAKSINSKTLKHEPRKALAGGRNGLETYQKFFPQIPNHLKKSAQVFLEIDPKQKKPIKKLTQQYLPAYSVNFIKDLTRKIRIVSIFVNT